MAKRISIPLFKLKDRYVSPPMLKEFNVKTMPLDFRTGNLPDQVQAFIRPLSPQTIAQMLHRSGSLTLRRDFVKKNGPDLRLDDDYVEATFFWDLIETHLKRRGRRDDLPVIPYSSRWRLFSNESKYLTRLSRDYANWQVKAILRYCIDTPDKGPSAPRTLDPAKPHTICFLADEAPLTQGQVSTSELNTVVWLAGLNYLDSIYSQHSVVPITVVSASGRRVRVVQGNVNFRKCTVGLRISEIVEFEKGVTDDRGHINEKYLTLLGWLIGDPVGNTS